MRTVLFLDTGNTSRGGLYVSVGIMDKETFLKKVDKWHEHYKDKKYITFPTYRYAYLNGSGASNFKGMSLSEFEAIFNAEDDISKLGRLLEIQNLYHGTSKYPVFKKEIYAKYGYNREDN